MGLLQAQGSQDGRVGPAIPNNYTVQELKSYVCCPWEPAVGCGWRPVAGFPPGQGAGSPRVQAVLGRDGGWGRLRTLSRASVPREQHSSSTPRPQRLVASVAVTTSYAADSSWGCAISKYWLRLLTPALLHPWIFSLLQREPLGVFV